MVIQTEMSKDAKEVAESAMKLALENGQDHVRIIEKNWLITTNKDNDQGFLVGGGSMADGTQYFIFQL